ncbi:MAG: hypothetical protein GX417_13290 [Clostridiales bacterium]|nr:hypothetical protein [Clostridiales bacterium]
MYSKVQLPVRIKELEDELYSIRTQTCYERAKIITGSYQKTEGLPTVLRRGRAFQDILTQMPLYIREKELIVGSRSSHLGWETSYPEYDLEDHDAWPEEVRAYWTGKTIHDLSNQLYPPIVPISEAEHVSGYTTGTKTGIGHGIAAYDKVLRIGFRGILEELDAALQTAGDDQSGVDFLNAAKSACTGMIAWANRYADLAENLAKTANAARAKELADIAAVCRHVPEHPARSFREALQSFWFVHVALHIEQKGWSISTGRFDQYMYPYYRADIEKGLITDGEAFELLLNLWVKFMENIEGELKKTQFQNLTLGGQDQAGNDLSNAFSHMCLDATMLTGYTQPALSVRWHSAVDHDFWAHAMRTIATGVGMPALFNDEIIMKELEAHGTSADDTWNYAVVGCVEPAIPGKQMGMTAGGHVNVAKALELALFNGRSLFTGVQMGPATGEAAAFSSFDQLWEAYEKQSRYLMAVTLLTGNVAGTVQKLLGHCPMHSCLLDDCIARRRDMVDGGVRYSLSGTAVIGTPDACDGLLAIKKLVFEEKRYTLQQICRAMEANFEGYEEMRQILLHQPCRFGNDIPEADEMANKVNRVHSEFCVAHPDMRGGHYTCGIWPVNDHVAAGKFTAALPDGRHKGAPLADGVGACHGADVNGPTALLKSVARLNNVRDWQGGNTCNIKFSKMSIHSPKGIETMGDLAETFMKLGGQELQINVVDAATLHKAQENPEEYANLVVRVAGYSAYFVTLSRSIQDEVIARTEQAI